MSISEIVTEFSIAITAISTLLMCIATTVMAIATKRIAKLNQETIKAGETPRVIVFLDFNPIPIESWKFDIVLANIGHGPARNVSFEFDSVDNHLLEEKQPSIKYLATMGDMFFE